MQTRRRIRTFVLCVLSAVVVAGTFAPARAADQAAEAAFLAQAEDIIIGPFLTPTQDLATSVGVGWVTKQPGAGAVEYGTDTAAAQTVREDKPATDHFVLLEGLKPGATYKYRVKTGELASKEYSFRTSPPDGKFTLLFGADWHFQSYRSRSYPQQRKRFGISYPEMLKADPDVVFIQGDNAEATISSVYNLYGTCRDLFASAIFIPVIGNHDWSAEGTKIFKRLARFPGGEDVGSFIYGRAHIISDRSMNAKWLMKVCKEAEGKVDWRLYGKHHPLPYSHTKRSGPGSVPRAWQEVFGKYPLDFAMYGHRHQYERSHPVRLNPYNPGTWGVLAGTDPHKYVGVRGATISFQSGSMWYGFTNAIPDLYHAPKQGIPYNSGAWQTFTVIDFDGKKCLVTTHAANRGSGVRKIIDRFTIDNTGDDPGRTPKIVSAPQAKATGHEAVISFTTDVPAKSMVRLGKVKGKYALKTPFEDVSPKWVTDHAVQLNCLEPETTYFYVAEAFRDTRKVVSEEGTFKTGPSAPGMVVGKFDFGFTAYGTAGGCVKDIGHAVHPQRWFGWKRPAGSLSGASLTELGGRISDGFAAQLKCTTRDGVWSVNLPNGKYDLEITSGGKTWRARPYKITVQTDQAVLTFDKPDAINKAAATATVTDGRLKLHLQMVKPKDKYGQAKLNLLVITRARPRPTEGVRPGPRGITRRAQTSVRARLEPESQG